MNFIIRWFTQIQLPYEFDYPMAHRTVKFESMNNQTLNPLDRFTPAEDSGIYVMSREKARLKMRKHAADITYM